MRGQPHRRPDRTILGRIIREEAARAKVAPEAVIHGEKSQRAVTARERAVIRALNETNCSVRGLARVWGLDRSGLHRIIRRHTPGWAGASIYADGTIDRLKWVHAPSRVARIIDGTDRATNRDIAAWNRLGERRRAA